MMNDQTDKLPRAVRETGAQYVVDTEGQHVAVLLPIKEYEHYLELLKREASKQNAKPAAPSAQDDSQPADLVYPTRSVPAERLDKLTGLVEMGGDALADSEALYKPSDEDEEVTQILVAAGLMRTPVDRSSPPPDPVSAQERRELAEILGRAPGKPLSEIIIEERGEW
jgi:PHD/YefM family antitoxin component YafN of YafNO toxin-antitoxin module